MMSESNQQTASAAPVGNILKIAYGGGDSIVFDGTAYVLTGLDCHDLRCSVPEYRTRDSVGILHGEYALFERRCVLRGVVLSGGESETLAERRARLGRAVAPGHTFTLIIGDYSAYAYTESMPEYDSSDPFGSHTGAAAFKLEFTMPYPAMRGEELYQRWEGIPYMETVEMGGDIPVGFSVIAEISGPETEVTLTVTDEYGHSRSLTVVYDLQRYDQLSITTRDDYKSVTLCRGDDVYDLLGSTECEKFPRLLPGENYISFSDQSAILHLSAYPAYLNIEELL